MEKFWVTNKVNDKKAEILLYGYIDPYDVSASDFVKELRSLEKEYSAIDVRINSGGGSVFEGFTIYNALKNSKAIIETFIDGVAASMASIIALAGKRVHMSKNARYMTHKPTTGAYGDSDELKKNAQLLEGLENTAAAIYAEKTGLSMADCKTKFMNGKDNWFTAEEAKAAKLVDAIYDGEVSEEPAKEKDEKMVYDFYAHKFAAKFNQQQTDNMEIKMTTELLQTLGLQANADAAAIAAAIKTMAQKAAQYDQVKGQLDAANTAKAAAEQKYNDLVASTTTDKVKTILDAGVADKKMTVEMRSILEKQYAGKPDELKSLVDAMKPYESVAAQLQTGEVSADDPVVKGLMAKSGEDLWRSGELDKLKKLNLAAFKIKYKEYFEEDYAEA